MIGLTFVREQKNPNPPKPSYRLQKCSYLLLELLKYYYTYKILISNTQSHFSILKRKYILRVAATVSATIQAERSQRFMLQDHYSWRLTSKLITLQRRPLSSLMQFHPTALNSLCSLVVSSNLLDHISRQLYFPLEPRTIPYSLNTFFPDEAQLPVHFLWNSNKTVTFSCLSWVWGIHILLCLHHRQKKTSFK